MNLEIQGSLTKVVLAVAVYVGLAACSGTASSDGKQLVPDQLRAERQGEPVTEVTVTGNYLAGKYALRQRDTQAAADFFTKALAEAPDDAQIQFQAYISYLANGDLDEAIPLARKLVKKTPAASAMNLLLAVDDVKAGNYEAASVFINNLENKGFNILVKPLLLAWIDVGSGNTDMALKELDALDKYDGFKALKVYHAGLLADIGGQDAKAEQKYKAAIDGPAGRAVRLVQFYGSYLVRHDRRDEARVLFENYLLKFPISPSIQKAISDLDAGKPDLYDVKNAKHGVAEALYSAATALAQERARGIAISYIYLALRLKPDFPAAQVLLGEIWEDRRSWVKAQSAYQNVDKQSAQARNAAIRIAWTTHKLGNRESAVTELERLAGEDESDIEPLVVMADLYRDMKEWNTAAVTYGRALDRLPKLQSRHWALLYARGIAYEQSKQWSKAEDDLQLALKLRPDHPQVMNYLAYSWVDRDERLEEARKMLEKAVSLRPRDGYIIDSLGWLYYRLGDFNDAVLQLEKAVSLQASDPTINDHLGDAYWRVGRTEEARYQWQRAIWIETDKSRIPAIQDKLKSGLADIKPGPKKN